jgi:hypothetical protein
VFEYVPESRIGWISYGASSVWGPVCDAYHTWLLTPIGAKKCHVIFEKVATGLAAQHTRGVYPEILHLSHQQWLGRLKDISESRTSKGISIWKFSMASLKVAFGKELGTGECEFAAMVAEYLNSR